jgi:hypothetical protein
MRLLPRFLLPASLVLALLAPLPATGQTAIILDVEPETETVPTGGAQTLTATAPVNSNIDFGITSGPGSSAVPIQNSPPFLAAAKTCKTPLDGTTCTVTFDGVTTAGTQTICAWIRDETPQNPGSQEANCSEGLNDPPGPDPDDTDVVEIAWVVAVLNLEPEQSSPPPSTETTLTATVTDNSTDAKPIAVNVDVEIVSGPNTGKNPAGADMECDTASATGICTVKYTGSATVALDTVRAWIDSNDNGKNAPEADAKGDEVPGEADQQEKRDAAASDGVGSQTEPDKTDVVEVNWGGPQPAAPGTPGGGPNIAELCSKTREKANQKEILVGDEFANKICGFGGNDTLRGLTGNDVLLGGPGDDKLKGADGNDTLKGQAGKKDLATGGKGKDKCEAEKLQTCEGPKKKTATGKGGK